MTMRLDISIGPVQGFVAQSRRTRDLWGSSYLLSFLSAHAIFGTCSAGARVISPNIDHDALYQWVAGNRIGDPPRIGSVPNHFVLEIDDEPSVVAGKGEAAFAKAWDRVCDSVWDRFVQHACAEGDGTREIWKRQTASFWELIWTAENSPAVGDAALARRKRWRTHRPPEEPGDKCTIMHDLQELSGFVRAASASARERQDAFWACVRGRVGALDLREDERLCAIALVKRLFAKVAPQALGWNVDTVHWPSTVAVAATTWIQQVVSIAPGEAQAYASAVAKWQPGGALPAPTSRECETFLKRHAEYLHVEFLKDERFCPLNEEAGSDARAALEAQLRGLQRATHDGGRLVRNPSKFYGLLLADGDRLGPLVGRLGGKAVGAALSAFTAAVPSIVQEHHGVAVYAGGDDVLAMLPVPTTLACAARLAEAYVEAFKTVDPAAEASLSAGMAFAHVRSPLGAVVGQARRLLDDVAKDENGRNSLAVGVLKRSGLYCQWATTWRREVAGGVTSRSVDLVQSLAATLAKGEADPGLSSNLLYKLRDTLSLLCGWPRWEPGVWGELPNDLDIRAFIHAEVLRSVFDRPVLNSSEGTEVLTETLMRLLHPSRVSNGSELVDETQAGVDAYLLARFLAVQEHEEEAA